MRDLNFQLKKLVERNRDGSYSTQVYRERVLTLIANELHEIGYRHMGAKSLKPKHVHALVARWREQDKSIGTIKNRLSVLRWWAEKAGKPAVVARSNAYYGIPNRELVVSDSKAVYLSEAQLRKVRDTHVRMSLELQREFGLRREEAIKFIPGYADRGDRLVLKETWTKGGKSREIPIRTRSQRAVLERAHQLAGRGSLIPYDRKYVEQLRIYERHTNEAGLSNPHGLRHAYAHRRYEDITGWKAPAVGGPSSKALSAEQKRIDREARLIISRELGHEREQIVAVYCGA